MTIIYKNFLFTIIITAKTTDFDFLQVNSDYHDNYIKS